MRLDLYCESNKVTALRLASDLRVSLRTAYRYLRGERIPDQRTMERVRSWSKGKVTANDFYSAPRGRGV